MGCQAVVGLRWLDRGAEDGITNMAIDRALLESAASRPTLRVYGWSSPTVSLGRFQSPDDRPADLVALPWVRRMSGGGAILHRDEITYALAMPRSVPDERAGGSTLLAACALAHRAVARALEWLGLTVQVRGPRPQPAPSRGAAPFLCYARAGDAGIFLADGRKLVGSAQRRTRTGWLQHGSIPLGRRPNAPGGATLALALGRRVPYTDVARALRASFSDDLDLPCRTGQLTAAEQSRVHTFAPDVVHK